MDIKRVQECGRILAEQLGLASQPVGVKLGGDGGHARALSQHRYCQALMLARRGEHVQLTAEGISCPAAAKAFGFRELPEQLANGKGLVGFGITKDPVVGQMMFQHMPRLRSGSIQAVELFPLAQSPVLPDVVVIEDEVEKLMWIVLAYLHAKGGERVESSTAVLQAACVDATVLPHLEERLNLSYGCYGCRDATDIHASETVLGFPLDDLELITEHVQHLGAKAMPTSRSKKAYSAVSGVSGSPHCRH